MRLALILFRKKMPHGHIRIGKDRLPLRVHDAHLDRMKRRLDVEEKNMLLLRNPYQTIAETGDLNCISPNSENFLGKPRKVSTMIKFKNRPLYHVRIEDRLGGLLNTEAWD